MGYITTRSSTCSDRTRSQSMITQTLLSIIEVGMDQEYEIAVVTV